MRMIHLRESESTFACSEEKQNWTLNKEFLSKTIVATRLSDYRLAKECQGSERHETSPRRWITRHVYVHVMIGPIVLFVVIKSVCRIGYAVSTTRSWWVLFQRTITRSWPLSPGRRRRMSRRHWMTGWEICSRHSVRNCGQRLSRLSQFCKKRKKIRYVKNTSIILRSESNLFDRENLTWSRVGKIRRQSVVVVVVVSKVSRWICIGKAVLRLPVNYRTSRYFSTVMSRLWSNVIDARNSSYRT